jgi:hypothetical protein
MPNKSKSDRPVSAVITVPDPDNMPVSSHAEQGGTLQWRTDTHNYRNFVIEFQGANPSDGVPNQKFPGSDEKPVVIRLNTIGDYKYTVQQINENGTCQDSGPFLCYVYPCKGCR